MSSTDRPSPLLTLSLADAAALDALVAAGLDLSRVPADQRLRADAILRVLHVLDVAGAGRTDEQVNAVRARLAEAREPAVERTPYGWQRDESGLIDDDIEALEALVGAGYDPRRVPSALRERADHQAALLSLLATPMAGATNQKAGQRREALVRRTMDAVDAEVGRQTVRMRIEPARMGRGLRMADLVSVAAVIVVGALVLLPVFSSMRDSGMRAACSANFAAAGLGFGTYANDYRESLPMASASLAGGRWWEVGKNREESNSANLYTLARAAYVRNLEPLACPACEHAPRGKCLADSYDWCSLDEVSYSYQNLFSNSRPRWGGGGGSAKQRMVVLADRSPITLGSIRKQAQNPFLNSPNHGGRGQTVLFNDGSAQWARDPVLTSGDNIWLPREIELGIQAAEWSARIGKPVMLIGREEPGAPGNVFLGP